MDKQECYHVELNESGYFFHGGFARITIILYDYLEEKYLIGVVGASFFELMLAVLYVEVQLFVFH